MARRLNVLLLSAMVSLISKKKFLEETVKNFQDLAKGGPENYFGAFRSSESCLWKAVDLLAERSIAEPTPLYSATGLFTTLSIPLALFYKKWSKTLANQCLQLALAFSIHPLEVVGTVLKRISSDPFFSSAGRRT